jgi:RNA polymerase sigma factor (sigma-70 family)
MDVSGVPPAEHMLNYLTDEILVFMAQVPASTPAGEGPATMLARDIIISRYLGQIQRFIAKRASSLKLLGLEVEDVQQDAWLWLIDAISKFDSRRGCPGNPDRFRSFVFAVVRNHLRELARRSHTERATRSNVVDVDKLVTFGTVGASSLVLRRSPSGLGTGDAAQTVEWREQIARLYKAVMNLDHSDQCIWFALKLGISSHAFLNDWGMTNGAFYSRRRRMLDRLRARLNPDSKQAS